MRRRLTCAFSALPAFILADAEAGRLTHADLGILARLLPLARDGEILGWTDARLARFLGIAESTWKAALKRLRAAGRILCCRVRTFFRRVLVIAWLQTPAAGPLFCAARGAGQQPPEGPVSGSPAVPPPDPPVEEIKNPEVVVAVPDPPEPAPISEPDGTPPPPLGPLPRAETPLPGELPDSGADPAADLVDAAQEVLPEVSDGWVRALVRRFGPVWVLAALRRARQRQERGATIRTGYLVATLRGFAEEGGPPAELLPQAAPATAPETASMTPEESRALFVIEACAAFGVRLSLGAAGGIDFVPVGPADREKVILLQGRLASQGIGREALSGPALRAAAEAAKPELVAILARESAQKPTPEPTRQSAPGVGRNRHPSPH